MCKPMHAVQCTTRNDKQQIQTKPTKSANLLCATQTQHYSGIFADFKISHKRAVSAK